MEPREIIERLIVSLDIKTQAQLAASLEIKPQSIISAVSRGEVPDAWLYRVAYLTQRNVDWLRTGKGPMWHGHVTAETMSPLYGEGKGHAVPLRRLLEAWEDFNAEERVTVARCADALRIGDREIREHLMTQLKMIEETIHTRQAKRARRRRPLTP